MNTMDAATTALDPEPDPVRDPDPDPQPEPVLEPELVSNQTPRDLPSFAAKAEQALERQATDLVGRAKTLTIIDPATFALAGRFLETLKDQKRRIVEFFEADIQRAHAAWKGLTTKRASFVDPLEEAIVQLSARYGTFAKEAKAAAERERQRLEKEAQETERARLQAEADRLAAEAREKESAALTADTREEAQQLEADATELQASAADVRQEAATVQAPVLQARPLVEAPKGTSIKANWSHEVTDKLALIKAVAAGHVSHEALIPNDVYLRARAKADKDTARIPGVRFYDAVTVSHKRR